MALLDLADPVVWLLTARDGERHGAMMATFVMPATLARARPRVLAAVSTTVATHALIERSGRFALQLLERAPRRPRLCARASSATCCATMPCWHERAADRGRRAGVRPLAAAARRRGCRRQLPPAAALCSLASASA